MFGSPKLAQPPPPPPPPAPPKVDDPSVKEAEARQRARARLARGFMSTLATGPRGLTQAPMEPGQTLGA